MILILAASLLVWSSEHRGTEAAYDVFQPWLWMTMSAAGSNVECSEPDSCVAYGEDAFHITIDARKIPEPSTLHPVGGFDSVEAEIDLRNRCPEGGPADSPGCRPCRT